MKTWLATLAVATVLGFAIRPGSRETKHVLNLIGLWAYVATVDRSWPDRKLVMAAYRSAST